MFDIRGEVFYRFQEKTIMSIMVLSFITNRLKTNLKKLNAKKGKENNVRIEDDDDTLGIEMDEHLENKVDENKLDENEKKKKMIALEVLMNLYREDIDTYEEHHTRFFAEELVSTVDDLYDEDSLAPYLRKLIRDQEKQDEFFQELEQRVREKAVNRIKDM